MLCSPTNCYSRSNRKTGNAKIKSFHSLVLVSILRLYHYMNWTNIKNYILFEFLTSVIKGKSYIICGLVTSDPGTWLQTIYLHYPVDLRSLVVGFISSFPLSLSPLHLWSSGASRNQSTPQIRGEESQGKRRPLL